MGTSKVADVRETIVRGARGEARADGSAGIEAEHILLALAAQDGSPAQRLLAGAGLDHDAIRVALDREWEHTLSHAGLVVQVAGLPAASADPARRPQIAESAKLALKRAMAAAAATGGGRIGPVHLLVGVLQAPLGRVPRALGLAGVDRAALMDRAVAELAR
ncbi:MAG TPA: Clp protease N-terminal domain-containing protein [Kribbellaceae bacterium]